MHFQVLNFVFSATTKERQKRFDAVVNVKQVLDVYETDQTDCMAVTGALKQTEENIRQLVGENQILKNAVKNAKAQIYETLRLLLARFFI